MISYAKIVMIGSKINRIIYNSVLKIYVAIRQEKFA
jgi:hypothetical protein